MKTFFKDFYKKTEVNPNSIGFIEATGVASKVMHIVLKEEKNLAILHLTF